MVINKNVTQTPGVDSNCKNVCLIAAGRDCCVHGSQCKCWLKKVHQNHLPAPFCLQIVLTPSCADGYCLLVLVAWENRKVNGVIAQRMDKFHSYLCQSMLGLDPKSHFILGIRDLWDTDGWITLWECGVLYSGGNESLNWASGSCISTPF